jgi:hypothetical protein
MFKLGVDISEAKSHVSKNTYEFAKRWFQHNVEISGLPLRGITSNVHNLVTIINIVVNYIYRVKPLTKFSSREIIAKSVYGLKLSKRILSLRKLNLYIDSVVVMIRYTKGIATYQEIRNYLSSIDTNSTLTIPTEDEIRPFIARVLSIGLQNNAEHCYITMKDYFERFRGSFNLEKSELKHHPIV